MNAPKYKQSSLVGLILSVTTNPTKKKFTFKREFLEQLIEEIGDLQEEKGKKK